MNIFRFFSSKLSSVAPSQEVAAKRRSVLWLAGVAAAAAGLGFAVWRSKPTPANVQEPLPGFWSLQWQDPAGVPVLMQAFQGAPLLINFWATWCPPCVEELPLIQAFYEKNADKGWKVLALAVDKPAAVKDFLQQVPLSFPIAIAGASGADFGKQLGNLSGGLPFTVVVNAQGVVIDRKMGRLSAQNLSEWGRLE